MGNKFLLLPEKGENAVSMRGVGKRVGPCAAAGGKSAFSNQKPLLLSAQ